MLRGLLVLALLGGVGVAQAGELFGGGFVCFFEGLQRGFAFLLFGFEGVDLVLPRQLVVAVEGEVLRAGGELFAGDVGVVGGEGLECAEPGMEVGVALDVWLPGGGDVAVGELWCAVGKGGLPVFGAEDGVQALAEVAADGGLPCWRDVQVVEQLGGGGEFGRLVLWRGLEAAQGVERRLLLGVAGVGGAGLGLLLVVAGLGGGEFGGGLLLGVFEGDEGFGEGVVLGLQGFGFEGVVVGVSGGL